MATRNPLAPDQAGGSSWKTPLWAAAIGSVTFLMLAHGRLQEPYFLDETNYLVQAYHADLLLAGRIHDPAWLTVPALDQPPLMKYLVGLALLAGGQAHPRGPEAAIAWQREFNLRPVTTRQLFRMTFVTPRLVTTARWPSAVAGALGCAAVFGLGAQMRDRRVGLAASALLMLNPLYRMESQRAVNDVLCEALTLASAAVALGAWRRCLEGRGGPIVAAAAVGAGVLGGLAMLAKLNGVIALMQAAAWAALAGLLPRVRGARKAALAVGATAFGLAATATVLVGNPTLTIHPRGQVDPEMQAVARAGPAGRLMAMVEFRARVSRLQQRFYPRYALESLPDKVGVVVVQGFGRFGPFGPAHAHAPVRYNWPQDWGATLWLPWVALGAAGAAIGGRQQLRAGEPPAAWAILSSAALTLACVVGYIPLAWDRYLLPLQPWAALLAAWAVVGTIDAIRRRRGPNRQRRDGRWPDSADSHAR